MAKEGEPTDTTRCEKSNKRTMKGWTFLEGLQRNEGFSNTVQILLHT